MLGTAPPVYILINNHAEGDYGMSEGDPLCSALVYQTATLPSPGPGSPEPSFAQDIAGTALIREILDGYTDSVGRTPRVLICPAGGIDILDRASVFLDSPRSQPEVAKTRA